MNSFWFARNDRFNINLELLNNISEVPKIKGGNKLEGTIVPQGAKNEALQIICATLLTKEEVVVDNIPNIIDVKKLINLLKSIGVEVSCLSNNKYSFK